MEPRLSGIRQIAITVSDVDAALAFYRDVLGLPFLFQPAPTLAFLDADGIRLMLTTPQGAGTAGANSILYFQVQDIVPTQAALVARGLCPAVADYLVFGHRSAEPGHRLLLIHLQAQPLLDMELRVGQASGALLAWPLLQAAQSLLEH